MDRRDYLAVLGTLGGSSIAGCSRFSDESTGSPTGTTAMAATASPTATTTKPRTTEQSTTTDSTPEPSQTPNIIRFKPTYAWAQAGDVEKRTIRKYGLGGTIQFGFTIKVAEVDGRMDTYLELTIYDKEGEKFHSAASTLKGKSKYSTGEASGEEDIIAPEGFHNFYMGPGSDVEWTKGTYTAQLAARDNHTDEIDGAITEFQIVDPLRPGEVDIDSEIPNPVEKGEKFKYTLKFSNISGRDSSVVTPTRIKYQDEDKWSDSDLRITPPVPAGETEKVVLSQPAITHPGTMIVDLEKYGYRYQFNIQDA